jgi:hypothetical protein
MHVDLIYWYLNIICLQVNKYMMWVKTVEGVAVPVHYEMRGAPYMFT